jgi:hypothetical protein
MTVTFEPVELDTAQGDRTGMLVFADGRLLAVLSRLDADHGDLAGRWFVEAAFREISPLPSRTYESPTGFAEALDSEGLAATG